MEEILALVFILLISTICALIFGKLKIPSVASYIIAGLLVGPVLRIVEPSSVRFLADLGIALMTFQIGLNFRLEVLQKRRIEFFLLFIFELIFISFLCIVLSTLLGFPLHVSFVLILIAINSSTLIFFKLIENKIDKKNELFETIVGLGVAEDIFVMSGISILPSLASLEKFRIMEAFALIGNSILIAMGILAFSLNIVPYVINYLIKEKNEEILILLILSIAIGYGIIANCFGLSFAFGSFIGGILISRLDIPEETLKKIKSLRDLFAIIFFVSLGLSTPYLKNIEMLPLAIIIAFMLIMIRFISIVLSSWIILGYENAFIMGIDLMVLSEFALVVSREAYRFNLINETIFIASVFSVLFSSIIGSIFIEREEYLIRKIDTILPLRIKNFINKFSYIFTLILKKITISSEGYKLLLSLIEKMIIVISILIVGSILLQNIISIYGIQSFSIIISTIVIISLFISSFIILSKMRKDIDLLMNWYISTLEKKNIFKNSIYKLLFLIINIVIILNIFIIITRILSIYFEIANIFSSLIILIFAIIVILVFYREIKMLLRI
ncbi:MAG: cation:proton antiporter [Candidatus Verstraetearchaeota archaeon]|nr:cation:proton antiporter [Candidatus Verstraetearchaeota archaeon]